MTTVITNNQSLWREHPHYANYYLYLDTPPTVFAGTVSGAISNPLTIFEYTNTTGDVADLVIGQTIRWRDNAENIKGYARVRRVSSPFFPNTMFVNESSELNPQAGDIFEVLDEYRLWARLPHIRDDGTSYKDFDQLYTNQTAQWRPLANAGPYYIGTVSPITGSVDVPFDGRMSYANSGSLSSYSWDFVDGVPASSSIGTPQVTFPAGRRWVSLTVTDSNGNSEINHSLVVTIDGTTQAFTPARIQNITLDRREGATANVEVLVDEKPELGAIALIYGEDYYEGVQGVVGGIAGRERTKFMGYVGDQQVAQDPFNSSLNLRLIGPLTRLRQLVGFPQYLEYVNAPNEWTAANPLNAWLVLWYLLKYHTTAPEMLPIEAFPSGALYPLTAWSDDDLNTQLDNISQAINLLITCDRSGVLYFRRDPSWATDSVRNTLTLLASLSKADWLSSIAIERTAYGRVAWLEGSGIQAGNTGEPAPLFAVAYGEAPSDTGTKQRLDRLLAQSQSELNEWTGARLAFLNRRINQIDLGIVHGGLLLDPAWQQRVRLTVDPQDNKASEGFTDKEFFLSRVELQINPEARTTSERWTLEPIEPYFAATKQDYVGDLPNQQYTAQIPPASVNPPALPPQPPPPEPPPAPPDIGFATAWGGNSGYTTTRNTPAWVNLGFATGNVQSVVFDEFSDYADSPTGALGLYGLTENGMSYIADTIVNPNFNNSIGFEQAWLARLARGVDGAASAYGYRLISSGGTVGLYEYGFGALEPGTVQWVFRSGGFGSVAPPGNPDPAAQARIASASTIDGQFWHYGFGTVPGVSRVAWDFYTDVGSSELTSFGIPVGPYKFNCNLITPLGTFNNLGVTKEFAVEAGWTRLETTLVTIGAYPSGTYNVTGVGFTMEKTVGSDKRPDILAIDNIILQPSLTGTVLAQGFHYTTGNATAVVSRSISNGTTPYGGMGIDSFNAGLVAAIGNDGTADAVYISASYTTGTFERTAFEADDVGQFNVVHFPFREFGDQSLNQKLHAFDVLVGANALINAQGTASLWKVSFSNAGTVNGYLDITPVVGGTTFVVAHGDGNQVDAQLTNSQLIIGNFSPVGTPNEVRQLVSDDAGVNWSVIGSFDARYVQWADLGTAAAWLAGADGIYYTEDMGTNWINRTADYAANIDSLANMRGAFGVR